MDQKGQKCFAKKVMAKLSAKYRVGIWGVSSLFMDQIHKVIFDCLPYSKYSSELGQSRPEQWKTMKTDLEPWKTDLEPWKTNMEPWKTNLEPRKTMKPDLELWKPNLEPWKTMKTDLEVEVEVYLRQFGKVLIFRDKQTKPSYYI